MAECGDLLLEEEQHSVTTDIRQQPSPSPSSSYETDCSDDIAPKEQFQHLSHWIACFCIVTFDLELGQAIEVRTLLCTHVIISNGCLIRCGPYGTLTPVDYYVGSLPKL